MRRLGSHGVLDPDLATRLSAATGFRNVLVHGYADVDDTIVIDSLSQLDDLQSFIEQVRRWVESNRPPR